MKRLLLILLALLLLTASLASCTVRKSVGTETTSSVTDAAEATTELPPESTDEPEGPARTKHAETTPAATEAPATTEPETPPATSAPETTVPETTAPETTAPETTAPQDPDDGDYTKNY